MEEPRLRFTFSNVFRFQVVDGAAIPRRWGPRVEGIAADLTLDGDTFKVGEDISLHLAIANFDAEAPIYSMDPVWDPCDVVSIEVQDADGHPLPVDERFPNWSLCTGHGFAPRQIEKGKVIPVEKKLGSEGWLPNHPGTFTIVATWAPCFAPKSEGNASPSEHPRDLKTYAVARALAKIHILAALPNAN